MQPVLDFLIRYGYWVLFFNVLAEQLAIPIPATPVLLAMGALAGLGKFSFSLSLLLAVLACVICDHIWYELGKVRGNSILRLICKVSLEPDSCVNSTKDTFARWGAWSLVFAKFVPGLSAVAAPLSGLTRMPRGTYFVADLAGSVAWTGAYLAAGYLFRNQLTEVAESLKRFGGWVVFAAVALVGGYLGLKFYQRRRFLKSLKVSRVSPEELMALMTAGKDPVVVDLRHEIEIEGGVKLPGAIWIALDELEARKHEIPREREVILYCS
jgi:membrane protein DedA with SNARE-associated domain